MNSKLLLLAISVAAFSSCTTLYKSGQTPDDVYYSPVRTYGEQKEETRTVQQDEPRTRYYSTEDRTIRLGINDPRWRYFDNDYAYTPYNYGFSYGYYYNPYYWPYPVFSPIFITPTNPKNTTPRTANLGAYNPVYNGPSTNPKTGTIRPARSYSNSNNNNNRGSAVGNVMRQVFTPSQSNKTETYTPSNNNNNNTRSYTPATTTPSSSSSSSSSSGTLTRPARTGRN